MPALLGMKKINAFNCTPQTTGVDADTLDIHAGFDTGLRTAPPVAWEDDDDEEDEEALDDEEDLDLGDEDEDFFDDDEDDDEVEGDEEDLDEE